MKKLFALMIAVAMLLVMGSAFAESTSSITITRDDSWDSSAESAKATYTYYKIFDAAITTAKEVDPDTGELTGEGEGTVVYTVDSEAKANALPSIFTSKLGADGKYYITLTDSSTSAADIVAALKTMVADNPTLFPGTSQTSDQASVVLEVPSDGYYLIEASNGKDAAVQTIGNVTIKEKNDYPTVSKEQRKGSNEYKEDNVIAEVGTYIDYQITVHIPADATKSIAIIDKLSSGLEYDETSGLTLVPNVDYTDLIDTDDEYEDDATWQIKLSETVVAANRGADIVITYRAKVTADALEDSYRENEVTLKYDNENYILKDKTEYTTYYGGIEKIDGSSKETLEGVKFTVTVGEENFNVTKPEGKDYYIPGGDSNEVVTDANGKIIIRGLDEDKTYTLTETETQEGYNLLDTPKDLTLDEDTGEYAAKDDYDQIENNKGTQLPSTGGMGTTIFYVIGGLLIIGAAVVLVARRKAQD